jgi:hypothetical protein
MEKMIPDKASEDEVKDSLEVSSEAARDAEIADDKPPHHG